MEILEIKKNLKNLPRFYCNVCDFKCYMKCDWDRHCSTVKHTLSVDGNQMEIKKLKKTYTCECSKKYATCSGLWKHKKTCFLKFEKCPISEKCPKKEETTIQETTIQEKIDDKQIIMMLLKDNNELKQMIIDQCRENKELTTVMMEQQNKVLEICKDGTCNINSHNKSFNLNFFLNETCKNAMNIKDFVNSVKIQLSDLENVGEVGYISGISRIIIKNLKELDVTQRPVHCTDKKREVLYIKDEDKWERENEQNEKMRKLIKQVAFRNTKLLKVFREKHPDCGKSDSKYADQYNKLIVESMGGRGDNDAEKENKIIKNIAKEVCIEK
jgi:hypothetical protein